MSITLPVAEYRVYGAAARILTRIMGAQSPAMAAILRAQLVGRSPVGIADGHLDAMGWPWEGTKQTVRTG